MPINNYVRPQIEIFQQLEITLDEVGDLMATCVIGPNYDLYRYGKEEVPTIQFTTTKTEVPYTFNQEPGFDYRVDTNYVRVFAEDLHATIANLDGKLTIDELDPTIVRLPAGKYFTAADGSGLATELKGYNIQAGDLLKVKAVASDKTERLCTIIDLVGKRIPAQVTAGKVQVSNESVEITLESSATEFDAEKDTTYVLTVASNGSITVTDSAGLDVGTSYVPQEREAHTIGTYGVKVSITGVANLKEGDVFSVVCIASTASLVQFDGLQLDRFPFTVSDADPTSIAKATLIHPFTGEVCSSNGVDDPFTADEDKVTIKEDLSLYIPDQGDFAPFEDEVGKLFIQFRVLLLPYEEEEKFVIGKLEDIQTNFGTIDQDNDLAYGCYAALEGSAGRAIYAVRTRGTDEDAYMAAALKTHTDKSMYAYAILTEDQDCAQHVAEYFVELCAPDVKMWRRTFWGTEAEGEYVVASQDINGEMLKATFSAKKGSSANSTNNVIVQISDDNNIDLRHIHYRNLETTLRKGDFVQLISTGQKYKVRGLISSTEIELEEGPRAKVTIPQNISLIHADTAQNRREYIQQVCTSFDSLRKTVVWSDRATKDGEEIRNKYLACYVAGLASAVVPQQSLTWSEVTLVDNASRTYTQYTREDLDEIARYGCLVVAQDTKNGPCYVRHNLTTETDKGILYYEESCIRNIDNMSFQTEDVLQKYIGKVNVTPAALRAIYMDLSTLYLGLTARYTSELIGPQLINFDGLKVEQDPDLKSRVIVHVNWYIPAPLNNIRVYEMSFVADVEMAPIGEQVSNQA